MHSMMRTSGPFSPVEEEGPLVRFTDFASIIDATVQDWCK
jgi:hypothetical protein